jgi:nitroreductase
MNTSLDFIFRRRSVRKFTQQLVEEDKIRAILEAAMAAPSSGNRRPWYFVVVQDRGLLIQMAEAHPNGKMLAEAPLALVACAQEDLSPGAWVQDCSAALENIFLAAPALELGGVWLGVWPRIERVQAISKILDLPENLAPLGIAALGYPRETPPPRTQFDENRVIWR